MKRFSSYHGSQGRPLWDKKGLGLLNINFNKRAQQFQNENWIIIKMKLNKKNGYLKENANNGFRGDGKKIRPA